jgi:hypothetical protein
MSSFIEKATKEKYLEVIFFVSETDKIHGRHYLQDMSSDEDGYEKALKKLTSSLPKELTKAIAAFEKKLKKVYVLDYPAEQIGSMGILVSCSHQLSDFLSGNSGSDPAKLNYASFHHDPAKALKAAEEVIATGSDMANELRIQLVRTCAYTGDDSIPNRGDFYDFNDLGAKCELEVHISSNEGISFQCWEDGELSQEGYCYDNEEYTYMPDKKLLRQVLAPVL